jgi:hypothetical protein
LFPLANGLGTTVNHYRVANELTPGRRNGAFMKIRSTALALLCGAAFTACHGASGYTPQAGNSSPATTLALPAAAPQACTAKPASVPGKYIGMFASGTLTGKTFTSLFGQWSLLAYKKGAAASPATKAAPKPTPSPSWLYAGTYTMTKSKQKGCVLLVAGQAVKPDASASSSDNAVVFGAPAIKGTNYRVEVTELGLLSMKVTGLSASGGRGTATLLTQQLKPYDTATIVFSKRTSVNAP